MLGRLQANFRYAVGLRNFLRQNISIEQAKAQFRRDLAAREQTFLNILERGVYAQPNSPYLKLLRHAGIELADVAALVRDHGVENTLERLYDVGMHVTLDEYKGRQPVRRPGLEFSVRPSDFDNALLASRYTQSIATSGSRGAPTRVQVDFDSLHFEAHYIPLLVEVASAQGMPVALWNPGTMTYVLIYTKLGMTPEKVFSTIPFTWSGDRWRATLFNTYTRFAARLFGYAVPDHEFVTREEAWKIARWLAEKVKEGRPAFFVTNNSPAIWICLAAIEHGYDISGTVFQIGGEPYTEGKAEVIAAAGARVTLAYAVAELRNLTAHCSRPASIDDMHLRTDKLAAIQREKQTRSGSTVQALILTTLAPSSPKLWLNVDSGDYATLEERHCGCLFDELGLTTHVSGLRSYDKLTSEGVTFIGNDLYRLLEEVLPARFGGHPTDYQLDEDHEAALPSVNVIVSPRVGAIDEAAVISTVLGAFEASKTEGARTMAEQWRQAGTLRVLRREPYVTRSKVPPLHVRA